MIKYSNVNIVFLWMLASVLAVHYAVPVAGWIYIVILFTYLMIQVYGSVILSAQFFIPVSTRGKSSMHSISLTFDDGPIAGKTDRVLDILKAHGVSAAFFCIGHRAKENPALLKRIQQEGHVLGNHSYWHGKSFDLQTTCKIGAELTLTDAVIYEHTGLKLRFFRPPYGVTNPMVASAVLQTGYKTIGWSVRSFDTMTKDCSKLLNRIIGSVKSGDIILLHDNSESMIQMLPALIKAIQNLGLKIVRVDELLNEKPYV